MSRREQGTFVISWSQTELDGLEAAPVSAMGQGVAWSWRGQAGRIDRLDDGSASGRCGQTSAEAATRSASLVRPSLSFDVLHAVRARRIFPAQFTVTNGAKSYSAKVIRLDVHEYPLLVFEGVMPPRETELWVMQETVSGLADEPALPEALDIGHGDGRLASAVRADTQAVEGAEVIWIRKRVAQG